MGGMLRSAKEEMKEEMKEGVKESEETMDKKLESAVSRMQEMMKGMFKEFFGEGAVGGGSPRSWDGPEGLQKVEKSGDESDGSDLGAVKKEKKGEMLAKGKREDKVKKGGEEKKKKGKGLMKDEKKVEIGKLGKSKEQDENELDSEDWIRVVEKKGKKSTVGRMDVSVEADSLYSEECKKVRVKLAAATVRVRKKYGRLCM
ncbi:ABC transporter F family member 4-like [Macrobrachium rosenbergii]|uniref:ABC transporter F family member 4-like n=1 Tax=Macrobrachium rosenbergii TaxID=79674 RepID=UPI0034D7A822